MSDINALAVSMKAWQQQMNETIVLVLWLVSTGILLGMVFFLYVALKVQQVEKKIDNLLDYQELEDKTVI